MKPLFARSALALALLAPLAGWSQVSLSVTIAPPPLPVYAQPPIPGDGYIWTPGYWSWDPAVGDYVWVPGTWVLPPSAGLLWTPGYWFFEDSRYIWRRGYWGDHVGYYGGLHYGYGYEGRGYDGGRWDHGHFRYNQAVNNLPHGRVHDVYNAPPPRGREVRDSFNGGAGVHARPTPGERRFETGRHGDPTPEQAQHEQRAIATPEQRMGNNHGAPPAAATPRASGFGDPGVEHVRPQPAGREAPAGNAGMREQGRSAEVARPQGERPQGGRPEGGQQGGGRPEGGHAEGGRPQGGGGHQDEGQHR